MAKKQKKFADDGWAVWIDGDDTSTVYINDWLNPKGKSYVDMAIRVRGIKSSKFLHVYVPFAISHDEIEDMSLFFKDTKILQATFSAACIVDYMKNAYTSEIAYNGKTVDVVHISTFEYDVKALTKGTLIDINIEQLQDFIDNDEAYFLWRMPHKSLDDIFKTKVDVRNVIERVRDLFTTPVITEKYGYSVRINESRLLPEEITRIGAFHRQKLKKAVVTLAIDESYELNDAGCYRIRRMEEDLYKNFLPKDYKCENVITYQWNQNRDENLKGHFSFYYNVVKNSVNSGSVLLYMASVLVLGAMGSLIATWILLLPKLVL